MRQFSLIIKIIVGIFVLVNLTGCAMKANKHSMKLACGNAPVLYTNLKKPAYARRYILPSGQSCPITSRVNSDV